MKKSDPHWLSIRRLLTLLLIVLVEVGSVAMQVNGASFGANHHHPFQNVSENLWEDIIKNRRVNSQTADKNNTALFTTLIRKHYLHNMCSDLLVKVKGKGRKGINAKGKMNGTNLELSKLVFSPTPQGKIIIFGQHTAKAICFNVNGRLVGKDYPKAHHLKLCEFVEEYSADGNYVHYRSAEKPSWYMGFRKNGKSLLGTAIHKHSEDCFRFLKIHNPRQCRTEHGNGPANAIFCNMNFLDILRMDSLGHGKQHKGHRNYR